MPFVILYHYRDRGTGWAAIYGFARSRTRRKQLSSFEAFYKEYRRKIDKRKAFNAWKRIPKKDHDELMKGLAAWCAYWDERNEPQYVPYPAVWLNNRRWESEPPKITKKKNPALNYQQKELNKQDFDRMVIDLDEQ